MINLSKWTYTNEYGHDALCAWPLRPCHVVCDHIILWRSSKFSHPLAERLWMLSLVSAQDDECGSVDYAGWFGLFRTERAVLMNHTDGYVTVTTYSTDSEVEREWSAILESASYDF